ALERIEAERDVGGSPGAIGCLDRRDGRAVRNHADFDAVGVGQGKGVDGRAVRRAAERRSVHGSSAEDGDQQRRGNSREPHHQLKATTLADRLRSHRAALWETVRARRPPRAARGGRSLLVVTSKMCENPLTLPVKYSTSPCLS